MKQQHKGTPSKLLARNEKCSSVYCILRNDEAKTVFVNSLVFVSCLDVSHPWVEFYPRAVSA